jgi:hypothetical protein
MRSKVGSKMRSKVGSKMRSIDVKKKCVKIKNRSVIKLVKKCAKIDNKICV